jgi:hypothetical protein
MRKLKGKKLQRHQQTTINIIYKSLINNQKRIL